MLKEAEDSERNYPTETSMVALALDVTVTPADESSDAELYGRPSHPPAEIRENEEGIVTYGEDRAEERTTQE